MRQFACLVLRILRTLVVGGSLVVGLAVLAVTLVGFLPQHGYLADTLSQLRIVYMYAVLPLIAVFILFRSRLVGLVAGLSLIVNTAACMPLLMPQDQSATTGGPKLSLITANIWGAKNRKYDSLVQLVKERQPDVICLEEVTPKWMNVLKHRLTQYPYVFDEGGSGGSAIFSKLPIEQVLPPEGTAVRRFGVRGKLFVGGKQILLIAEHPPAPSERKRWVVRNREFGRLMREVENAAEPVLIAGDFNSTPWSSYFQQLLSNAKLQDSELGRGIQPTWNTHLPLPLVPIDHCLYTKEFKTVKREIGPDIGSDHLPLIVEVGLHS